MISLTSRGVLVACILAGLSTGCASVPLASKADDQHAKEFEAPGKMSRIYCYRPYKFEGSFVELPVVLDGKRRVDLASDTFTYFDVANGHHTVATFSNDPLFGTVSPIKVDIQPGEVVFLWNGFKRSGPRLVRKDEAEGMEAIRRCRLVQQAAGWH